MKNRIALLVGPFLFLLMAGLHPLPMAHEGSQVLGLVLWMLVWWISEAVPMAVTSLLPLLVLPAAGILSMEEASAPYGDKYVFLFLGGFLLALALEKWNLHKRLALSIVMKTGTGANRIILGFMLASFVISMWISNTATALMMFPIAMSVVNLLLNDPKKEKNRGEKNFSTTMLLGIAYGSSIGGIATLVGSPPNAAAAGILESNHGYTLTFFDWFKMGFPFAAALLLITYALLVHVLFPNRLGHFQLGSGMISRELQKLGSWSSAEKKVFVIFLMTASLWMVQEFLAPYLVPFRISDVSIALFGGTLLFLIPAKAGSPALLEWQDTEKLPWGILLMFGGGLSLAKAFKQSGLLDAVMHWMDHLDKTNLVTYVAILCLVGLVITALISNLAMVNIFVPVVAALAIGSGQSPEVFAIPVAISASCDFMFPMSTPPNAIAYSSGHIKAMDMFRAGFVLNVAAFLLLLGIVYLLL
jgi:solute carrier family 13 (sodium-dependent dicarboxylate transporter), member 2/3/5